MKSQWARWRLKSPASPLFTQPLILAQIKEKNQSSASLAFVREIDRWPVNSPHKGPVTRKMFPFDDVIMTDISLALEQSHNCANVSLVTPNDMSTIGRYNWIQQEKLNVNSVTTSNFQVYVRDFVFLDFHIEKSWLVWYSSWNKWESTGHNLINCMIRNIYKYSKLIYIQCWSFYRHEIRTSRSFW